MKKIQTKYNVLQILYWITSCSIYGYVAVFLQYKGLSNTLIGMVTGIGSISSVFLSPIITSLPNKIKAFTIKRVLTFMYVLSFAAFISLALLDLPTYFIIGLYVTLICMSVSTVPFLSTICMNYLKAGEYVNFGLARGMGSVSYAVSAVVLGRFIDLFNPTIVGYVHFISGIAFLACLYSLPDKEPKDIPQKEKNVEKANIVTIIKNYPTFFMILVAFAFLFAGTAPLGTYLINIVKKLGGSPSLYGIVIFAMAASEMPIMAATHSLLKKFKSEQLIVAAAFFYIARNFTIAWAPNLVLLIVGAMFQSVSYGLLFATITYYVNDHIKEEHQMMGQTMIGMMTSGLGSTLGNMLGGVLQDTFGLNFMLIYACVLTLTGTTTMFFTLRKHLK